MRSDASRKSIAARTFPPFVALAFWMELAFAAQAANAPDTLIDEAARAGATVNVTLPAHPPQASLATEQVLDQGVTEGARK